jgi:hypothetical protein
MTARLTLKPGQPGTKKLMKAYGDRLVCVRYRYDPVRQKRLKTVELIVDETDWGTTKDIPDSAVVGIRVGLDEKILQGKVKSAAGRWDAKDRLWYIRFIDAVKLGLKDRIVKTAS